MKPPHSSHSILIDTPIKDFSYIDDIPFIDPMDDSGDNLSHDSYELIEKELESRLGWKGSQRDSITLGSRSDSRTFMSSAEVTGSREGLKDA